MTTHQFTPEQLNNLYNAILQHINQKTERIEIVGVTLDQFNNLINRLQHDLIIHHFVKIAPTMYEVNDSLVYYDIQVTYGSKDLPSIKSIKGGSDVTQF